MVSHPPHAIANIKTERIGISFNEYITSVLRNYLDYILAATSQKCQSDA